MVMARIRSLAVRLNRILEIGHSCLTLALIGIGGFLLWMYGSLWRSHCRCFG